MVTSTFYKNVKASKYRIQMSAFNKQFAVCFCRPHQMHASYFPDTDTNFS